MSQVLENTLDAQSDSAFSAVAGVNFGSTFNVVKNSVRYDTPNFDGFSAAVQIGLGEDKNNPVADTRASRDTAFNVQYANGPLAVALAYGMYETDINANPFVGNSNVGARDAVTALAGSYDFGAAKLNLGFTNAKTQGATGRDRGVNVGVTAPIGAFTVVGQIARNKMTDDDNRTSVGLEGRYALSKRTTSYLGMKETKDNNFVSPVNNKARVYGVGVRHVF